MLDFFFFQFHNFCAFYFERSCQTYPSKVSKSYAPFPMLKIHTFEDRVCRPSSYTLERLIILRVQSFAFFCHANFEGSRHPATRLFPPHSVPILLFPAYRLSGITAKMRAFGICFAWRLLKPSLIIKT